MKVDTKASSVDFVYPFLFDPKALHAISGNLLSLRLDGRNESKLTVWKKVYFPTEELLPHVADYLNAPEGKEPTAVLLELDHDALSSPRGLGAGPSGSVQWQLTTSHGQIPIVLAGVRLALFQVGVGLLTISAQPGAAAGEISTWLDFIYYFRFARRQRGVKLVAQRRVGFDPVARQPQIEPYFPPMAGGMDAHPDGEGVLADLIDGLLDTAAPENGPDSWRREVFIPGQLLPYVRLYVDGVGQENSLELLHRVRNFFRSDQNLQPTQQDLDPNQPLLLPYSDQQWFFFSLGGGGFLACDAPREEFFRATLPDHLRVHYFLLFLLALQQRFALMMLTREVAEKWIVPDGDPDSDLICRAREDAFEEIRDHLLIFTARGHFSQIMQRDQHHRCYEKWRQVFQVQDLYQEVSDEVRYMHSCLETARDRRVYEVAQGQERQSERLNQILTVVALVVGLPALALAFLAVLERPSTEVAVCTLVGSLLLGVIVAAAVLYLFGREREP